MTEQEIFEMLSDIECRLYYANDETPTPEREAAHKAIREALEAFARATGCHNN